MIGYLRGTVIEKLEGEVIVDVSGVGYKIRVAGEHKLQSEIELFIHTYVREDTISLYGFVQRKALNLFELLITVSGIGPKVAMLIVASTTSDRIESAISNADVSFFTSIPGIGKKGAQKIIIELKSKIGSVSELDLSDRVDGDVVDGLVSMGFNKLAVQKILLKIEPDLTDSEKIKKALRMLTN